jgi:hypothetical protein
MSNPYTPGSALPPGGAVPPDLAKKAGNIQLMGILSIVFAFCCGIVSLVLGIIVLIQAGGVNNELARYGSPPDLVGKVSTGKNCAIAGLVITGLLMVCGVGAQVVQLMNQ